MSPTTAGTDGPGAILKSSVNSFYAWTEKAGNRIIDLLVRGCLALFPESTEHVPTAVEMITRKEEEDVSIIDYRDLCPDSVRDRLVPEVQH